MLLVDLAKKKREEIRNWLEYMIGTGTLVSGEVYAVSEASIPMACPSQLSASEQVVTEDCSVDSQVTAICVFDFCLLFTKAGGGEFLTG